MNTLYPPHSTLVPGSRVIAYLRDSGGDQQENSVSRQEEELRRWCARYSLELINIYADEARSASRDLHKRKDLLSMMKYLRDGGEAMGVVIWNYERIARNIKHGRAFIAEIEAMDKVICSLTDNIPEGPERYFMQDLKLWSAESAAVKNSIDVTSALRLMVETHGGMPGTPPRGMRRGEPLVIGTHRDGSPRIVHRWEPDPDLAPLVLFAFQMRAAGATLKQIMDATHIYSTINSYSTFFINRLYMGELVFGDLVIPNYCAPIVDRVTWKAANLMGQRRYHNNKRIDHPRRLASRFLLSGLVHCQHCGSIMNGYVIRSDTRHSEYYACAREHRRRDCPARRIPRLALENAVTDQLIEGFMRMDNLLAFQTKIADAYNEQRDRTKGERISLRRKLAALKKKISNLSDTLAQLGPSKAVFESLRQSEIEEQGYRSQLNQMENSASPPPSHSPLTLKQLAEQTEQVLRHGTDDQRRQYFHGLITRILAKRDEDGIRAAAWYILPNNVCLHRSDPGQEQPVDIRELFVALPLKRKSKLLDVS